MSRQTIKIELEWKKYSPKVRKDIQRHMCEALMETIKTFTGVIDAEVVDIKLTKINVKK